MSIRIDNVGMSGISVGVKLRDNEYVPFIQSRGVSFDDELKIEGMAASICDINISTDVAIQYCPFCGTDFRVWLRKNRELASQISRTSDGIASN
jgi:hypothetical protein